MYSSVAAGALGLKVNSVNIVTNVVDSQWPGPVLFVKDDVMPSGLETWIWYELQFYSRTVVRVLTRLLQANGGDEDGGGGSRSQNPHFNPNLEAWLVINSIYLKK